MTMTYHADITQGDNYEIARGDAVYVADKVKRLQKPGGVVIVCRVGELVDELLLTEAGIIRTPKGKRIEPRDGVWDDAIRHALK